MTCHSVIDRPRTANVQIVPYLREHFRRSGQSHEHFFAIFVDPARRYLGERDIGGCRSGSLRLRLRHIFADALAHGASGLIIAHNHPSGICRPSQQDIEATRRLSAIAEALDIELLDHLIITEESAYSMRAGEEL